MRNPMLRTGLLCGSLVMLSGCYSNGKFHSPTWNEMAWWRKDAAPNTSLAAAPSIGGRPSDEALADKNSPGARATAAPPYDAAAASYNSSPAAAGSRYPDTGYSNTGYPDTGYPNASTGGPNWAANGDASAANVASNPYAKSGPSGYDTGSRYDGRPADHAQRTPYDSAYPGAGNTYSTHGAGNAADRRAYSANDEPNTSGRGDYAPPTGPRDNPYYRSADPAAPAASPRYDEDRYSAPDRYTPPTNTGASTDKNSASPYVSQQDAERRYDSAGYRDMTGDRYLSDGSRPNAATPSPPADALNARTADSRNADSRIADASRANAYDPGNTGYQPAGVPNYNMPSANGTTTAKSAPYQPGGTSRYNDAATGSANSAAAPYGTNPYAQPLPGDRYRDAPANSRDGAARY